jgi:predicted dithiol-disulfide oxidoreductase (DUF899 family)
VAQSKTGSAAVLKRAERDLRKARRQVIKLRRSQPKELVRDYAFKDHAGKTVSLAQLFGAKKELILVHNMGSHCRYCTLWADGFTGLVPHLENRAAFAVESADAPASQKKFYQSRAWNFKMVSSAGTDFKRDMGFTDTQGDPSAGVSVFEKKNGKIYRTSQDGFGPGDDYCSAWHFFDLLPGGSKGWEPQYRYTSSKTGGSSL